MKIGITYDLREDYLAQGLSEEETAEFDQKHTIDAIKETLQELGYETELIGNIKSLTTRLVMGDRWNLVFNIAEGIEGFGREAQVPALLDAYAIPYTFSDPLVLTLTLHKAMAKHVIRDLDVPTPDFLVVSAESDIELVGLPFPLFAKPVAEGTGKGIDGASKIVSQDQLRSVCKRLLTKYRQPVLIETFLPGREFTVGILGTGEAARVIGAMEIILRDKADPEVYSYKNKEHSEELVEYRIDNNGIAEIVEETALTVWRELGCRDAGRVDLREDADGIPNVMEVNPLAGLHPQHSDLCIIATQVGMTYSELLKTIVSSAVTRYRLEDFSDEENKNWYRLQPASPLGSNLSRSLA